MALLNASQAAWRASSRLSLGSHTFIMPCQYKLGSHVVGYHVAGIPSGQPVFYFHGSPSSRLEVDNFHKIGEELDVCLIGLDRPGIGLSTFRPRFTLLDWPDTVRSLAAHLGFKSYFAAGCSGGGPYALACARYIPDDELKGVAVISGLGPPEAPLKGLSWERWLGFSINRWLPRWLLYPIYEQGLGRPARDPDQRQCRKIIIHGIIKSMSQSDQALIDEHETERMVVEMRESMYSGSDGNILDAKLILGTWPFTLDSVEAKVQLWNGTDDTDTPVHMARWMAHQLPNAQLTECPGLTHFSLSLFKGKDIFQSLIST